MILIIGAQREEVSEIKDKMIVSNHYNFLNYDVYEGTLNGVSVVLTSGGIGKVASTIILTSMLNKYQIDRVINVGTCGGLHNVKVFDIIIANRLVYLDADVTPFGYKYGQMAKCPPFFESDKNGVEVFLKYDGIMGDMISSDSFFTKNHILASKLDEFKDLDLKSIDMESTSIAQTCFTYGVKFNIIRTISDCIDDHNQLISYEEVLKTSSKKIANILYSAIKEL